MEWVRGPSTPMSISFHLDASETRVRKDPRVIHPPSPSHLHLVTKWFGVQDQVQG